MLRCLRQVIDANISGDICEFGCYAGTTSLFISRFLASVKSDKKLWVYDSFEGLPRKGKQDASPAGIEFQTGELKFSKKNFISNYHKANLPLPTIKKAWFNNLKNKDLPQKISLAFLDGDYYESVLTPLSLISSRVDRGSIIIVDDYANPKLPGAAKALDAWLKLNQANIKYKLKLVSDMAIVELL